MLLSIPLLIAIGALFRSQWSGPGEASRVRITAPDGAVEHNLLQDQTLHIHGALGSSQVQIAESAVRFVSSPCRHKICVRSGWHRRAGAVAACVPNRVSVLLLGQQEELDGISY